jgi:hypothetical protein
VTNKYDDHNFKMNHLLASILPLTASITGEAVTNNIVAGSQQTLTAQGYTGAVSYTISPALPTGLAMSTSTGLISGTPTGQYAAAHTITGTDASGAQAFQVVNINFTAPPPQGQTLYSSPGTYTFTVPARVATLSAVSIGGGGGGSYVWSYGPGGGGGLAWSRDIAVTPGETFTVVVGSGGNGWTYNEGSGVGYNSYLQRNSGGQVICRGWGSGQGGPNSNGGASGGFDYTGTGGGGRGGYTNWRWDYSGGGAGGYAGRGGEGTWGYNPGYGGGGAAGTTYSSYWGTPAGGGTGIYGQGSDGVGRGSGRGGGGGSGGGTGGDGEPYHYYGRYDINGGLYGGGAGGSGSAWYGGGYGGGGGVRIIWGPNRFYPNTNTNDVTTTS